MTRQALGAWIFLAATIVAQADFQEGMAAYERQDYAEAFRQWQPPAERGDMYAQFNLALLYGGGTGVEQNLERAAHWYRQAGEQGLAVAQEALGKLYAYGRGVTKDHQEAARWYRMAAEQGAASAQYRLAGCYRSGLEGPADRDQAEYWYRKAAEQGHIVAQQVLSRMLETDAPPESEQAEEVVRWLRAAAEQGAVSAKLKIGLSYMRGELVERDPVEAVHWLRQAAEQGLAAAQYHLGRMYRAGDGVEQNAGEARKWFRKAAASGSPEANEELSVRARLREHHLRHARIHDWSGGGSVIVRSPGEIRRGPPAPVDFGPDRVVHCEFFPRENKGGNPKFRCFGTTGPRTEGGHYYDVFGAVQPGAESVILVDYGQGARPVLARQGASGKLLPMSRRVGFREMPLAPLELKVKYRSLDDPDPVGERDMHSEVAATRLLWALHYPADRVYRVAAVHCHRCPRDPWQVTSLAPEGRYETFDEACIELRYESGKVEQADRGTFDGGWSWGDELWRLRNGPDGEGFSSRQKKHFDGLLVLKNLLQHVASLPEQNRLVCRKADLQQIGGWKLCPDTTILVHDLGSVFAKRSAGSLEAWRGAGIWSDPATCEPGLALRTHRADVLRGYRIGRDGQEFILSLLDQLGDEHLRALFESAGFETFDLTLASAPGDEVVGAWIDAFKEKVEQVRSGRCRAQ